MKSLRLYLIFTNYAFQRVLANRTLVVVFLLGKLLRVSLFLLFLLFLFRGATTLSGYSRDQIIFFYLSFNLIDTLAQLLFREVYQFRPLVVSGGFDMVLAKPYNPLLRVLLGGADVIDLLMLVILLVITLTFGLTHLTTNPYSYLLYFLSLGNGLVIAASFHILVLGLGIITLSVDHLISIYRDASSLFRIPADLYIEPIRSLLTFALPLGIMITFPAKSLMNLLSPTLLLISFTISILSLTLSLLFWRYALRHYQSASS